MINEGHLTDVIFYLNNKKFFKNIKKIIDMGDQDFFISEKYKNTIFNKYNIQPTKEFLKDFKNSSKNNLMSSSMLWKLLGVSKCDRIDMVFKKRFKNENNELIKFDLNKNFDKKQYFKSYDLVTDFGNNEHPFNIMETFQTMHKLAAEDGILWSMQSYIDGNGFYNFNTAFYEHLAAFNNYTILYSYYCVSWTKNKEYLIIPTNNNILDKINLSQDFPEISINYIFKKNNNENFQIPYQSMEYDGNKDALFDLKYFNNFPDTSRSYILNKIENINYISLLKEIILRIMRKLNLYKTN